MPNSAERPHLTLVVDNPDLPPPGAGASLAEQVLDYIGVARALRVVEFTYGPSRLGWRLQAAGCRVDCIDLALYPIDSIPLDWMGQFDLAVVTSALHQVKQPDLLLADIVPCLRPGGVCGGIEPSQADLARATLQQTAGSAGLTLVDVSEVDTSMALFWKGHVPSSHSAIMPVPAADPAFMTLAA